MGFDMSIAVACVVGADSRTLRRDLQRETPPGLSKRDVKVLRSVQRRAHYLDKGFHICGMRFGWTFIIGACTSIPWWAEQQLYDRRAAYRLR